MKREVRLSSMRAAGYTVARMNHSLLFPLAAICCTSILPAAAQEKPDSKPPAAQAAAVPKFDDLLNGAEVKPINIPEKSKSSRDFQRRMAEWVSRTARPAI